MCRTANCGIQINPSSFERAQKSLNHAPQLQLPPAPTPLRGAQGMGQLLQLRFLQRHSHLRSITLESLASSILHIPLSKPNKRYQTLAHAPTFLKRWIKLQISIIVGFACNMMLRCLAMP